MNRRELKSEIDEKIILNWEPNPVFAFRTMFRAYYDEVCQHIFRYVVDREATEDIAQDIFTELWNKRDQLAIDKSPGAYLRRMAVSRSLNYIRDNRKRLFHDEEPLIHQEGKMTPADQQIMIDDLQKAIDHAIDQLPTRCRQVFMLSRFEGMPYKQIADEMDISVKTVENQMIKALKHLREAVSHFKKDETGGIRK